MSDSAVNETSQLPTATLRSERRISAAWLVPLLALALAAWLGMHAWSLRGVGITVQLIDGHGLKPGDDVRYRGIGVGRIDAVTLMPDLQHVLVSARLTNQASLLAQAGSRFWVVRPQVQLTRVQGLETLIGPRFLAVLPPSERADGATGAQVQTQSQRNFVGQDDPPVVESILAGDLEIVLEASQRGSMHAGAPVLYRQIRVGTVLSVGLAGDSGNVEARIHIQQAYAGLIRPNTRFWDVGGLKAKVGITGISLDIDSAEALLMGGIALATPPVEQAGGDIVRTGHRFALADKPDPDWLEWEPMTAVGSEMLPAGAKLPQPLRATIGWKQGRFIKGHKSHRGWLLQTSDGLLGPVDLLKAGEKADRDSVVLEVNGKTLPLETAPTWERNGLAMLKGSVIEPSWPVSSCRTPKDVEECLAIADPGAAPLPLSVARLTPSSDGAAWKIDPAISIDPSWHGAAVVSRVDGNLIGILLVQDEIASVAVMPKP